MLHALALGTLLAAVGPNGLPVSEGTPCPNENSALQFRVRFPINVIGITPASAANFRAHDKSPFAKLFIVFYLDGTVAPQIPDSPAYDDDFRKAIQEAATQMAIFPTLGGCKRVALIYAASIGIPSGQLRMTSANEGDPTKTRALPPPSPTPLPTAAPQ